MSAWALTHRNWPTTVGAGIVLVAPAAASCEGAALPSYVGLRCASEPFESHAHLEPSSDDQLERCSL